MRKLLFLSLILLSFSVFAEDSTLKAIEDTSQVTFSKVYNDVKVGINAVASALKVGAEHVYEVLVKQQVVKAVTWLIFDIMFIIIAVALWLPGIRDETYLDDFWGIPFILSICALIIPIFNLDIIVTGFINPEYGVLQEIMSWIK